MTFRQYQNEDYEFLLYNSFTINMALHKQKPVKAVQYDCDKKMQSIVVFRESPNGNISTKRLTAPKEAMMFIRSWLSHDFPELEFEIVEGCTHSEPDAQE